jgi:hypothetical protein
VFFCLKIKTERAQKKGMQKKAKKRHNALDDGALLAK